MAAATGPELHLEFAYDSFARRLEKRVYRRGVSRIAELPAPKRGHRRGAMGRRLCERAEEAGGLPRFVVREVEEFLRCGLLDHGFTVAD